VARAAIAVAVALLFKGTAGAQSATAAQDAGFDGFLQEFCRALTADDRKAVASLTQLPFLYEGRTLDAAGFQAVIPDLFTAAVRRCLAQARPIVEDGRHVIFCAPYGFYFGRTGDGYRLVEFMADGEE
jgi:hypothetical protein